MDTELERELRSFDYSAMSAVKGKLLGDILSLRRNKRQFGSGALYASKKMSLDDLDMVSAAGTENFRLEPNRK
ncbi:MAG: hypothetical protein IJ668_01840 [Selenomonadaceae bacterium]|nr:hypothetical protein [Selenomonadaceae bacterium]